MDKNSSFWEALTVNWLSFWIQIKQFCYFKQYNCSILVNQALFLSNFCRNPLVWSTFHKRGISKEFSGVPLIPQFMGLHHLMISSSTGLLLHCGLTPEWGERVLRDKSAKWWNFHKSCIWSWEAGSLCSGSGGKGWCTLSSAQQQWTAKFRWVP